MLVCLLVGNVVRRGRCISRLYHELRLDSMPHSCEKPSSRRCYSPGRAQNILLMHGHDDRQSLLLEARHPCLQIELCRRVHLTQMVDHPMSSRHLHRQIPPSSYAGMLMMPPESRIPWGRPSIPGLASLSRPDCPIPQSTMPGSFRKSSVLPKKWIDQTAMHGWATTLRQSHG
jgi:hypothetical protein